MVAGLPGPRERGRELELLRRRAEAARPRVEPRGREGRVPHSIFALILL